MSLNLDRSSWKTVKFGDVVSNINENVKDPKAAKIDRVIGLDNLDPGELRISRWGDVSPETTFTRRVGPGQTLFGKRRAYQRKTAFAEFDALCSGDILVFEAKSGLLLPGLLPFVAMTDAFYAHALGTSAGSLSPRTRWSDMAKYEFLLPPLDEQRRIADLLWAAEMHRRAAVERASTLRLCWEAWRDDWLLLADAQNVTIGDVSTVRAGATPSRGKQALYFDGGKIPWVKTLDLNEAVVTQTDESITERAVLDTSCRVIPAGTVLVAMYGGFGQIGRTALLGVDAATNQAVSALTELREGVSPEYLQLVLQSRRGEWRRVAASSRKDPNITKKDVEGFKLPLPSLNAQEELVSMATEHELAQRRLATELRALAIMVTACLNELGGGE